MTSTEFVYTTYIKSTPEKVWNALTNPEFTRQYWNVAMISDWKKGSPWRSEKNNGGDCNMMGEVLESAPPSRLVYSWHRPADKDNKAEHSRVTYAIEMQGDLVRLTILHDKLNPASDMPAGIANGWPRVAAALKSLLETGAVIDVWVGPTCDAAAQEKKKVVNG